MKYQKAASLVSVVLVVVMLAFATFMVARAGIFGSHRVEVRRPNSTYALRDVVGTSLKRESLVATIEGKGGGRVFVLFSSCASCTSVDPKTLPYEKIGENTSLVFRGVPEEVKAIGLQVPSDVSVYADPSGTSFSPVAYEYTPLVLTVDGSGEVISAVPLEVVLER